MSYRLEIPAKIGNTVIVSHPDIADIRRSTDIINQFGLRLYQLLYSQKLALPANRGRWKIYHNYDNELPDITSYLYAFCKDDIGEICVSGNNADEIYLNVLRIENAFLEGKKRTSSRACCPLAEHNFCVCFESWKCPIHGTSCYGSHD